MDDSLDNAEPRHYHNLRWTKGELALLGTAPDAEVARAIGGRVDAVYLKRRQLAIPTYDSRLTTARRQRKLTERKRRKRPAAFLAALMWHLRRQGVPFDQAELETFAADVWPLASLDRDTL